MPFRNTLIVCVACGLVLLVALQPISVLVGLSILSLTLLAAISPFAAFSLLLILSPLHALLLTEIPSFPANIGQVGIFILLGAYLINKFSLFQERRWLIDIDTPMIIPIGTYLIVLGVASFNTTSGAWLNEWLKWGIIFLLVILLCEIGRSQQWKWIVFILVSAGAAHALIGLYTFLGGSGALHLLVLNKFFRAFGTFGQPNPFGGFMGLLLPIALLQTYGYLILCWGDFRSQSGTKANHVSLFLYYSGAALLIGTALVASWSRGAWLGFGISMLTVLIALPRKLTYGITLLVAVAILLGALWSTGRLPASMTERVESAVQELFVLTDVRAVDITPENYPIVERLAHWQAAINMFRSSPWLGVGAGNYEIVYDEYRLLNWREPLGHAHNYYLNVLAETGIIGLLAYLIIFINAIRITWFTRRHPDHIARCTVVGLLGTWTYLIVHSLTDNLYVNNLFIHLGVMFGILAILRQELSLQVKVITR